MRKIEKQPEPASLIHHRCQPNAIYENLPAAAHNDLRQNLLREQGYICCYCLKRIQNNAKETRIEHWHSRSKYPHQQLDYDNLLASCSGNQGHPPANQHCDVRKGSADIKFNPADHSFWPEELIRYLLDGTIKSPDTDFDSHLNTILNLNHERIKNNRKKIVDGVISALDKIKGPVSRGTINKMLQHWDDLDNEGMFHEYCGVAIYYLKKRLRRAV